MLSKAYVRRIWSYVMTCFAWPLRLSDNLPPPPVTDITAARKIRIQALGPTAVARDSQRFCLAYLARRRNIRVFEATITELKAEVAELKFQFNQNSANSSKSPSSDPPHVKSAPPERPSGKRSGGQPGHPKAERTLLHSPR